MHRFNILIFLLAFSSVCYAADTSFSFCKKSEIEVFNCKIKSKTLSLCGSSNISKTQGTLQYRFGTSQKIELQFPEMPKHPHDIFWLSSTGYSGGGESRIHFKNGAYDYILFDSTIRTGFDGNNNPEFTAGLAIKKNGKLQSIQKCSNNNAQILEAVFPAMTEEEFDYDVTP